MGADRRRLTVLHRGELGLRHSEVMDADRRRLTVLHRGVHNSRGVCLQEFRIASTQGSRRWRWSAYVWAAIMLRMGSMPSEDSWCSVPSIWHPLCVPCAANSKPCAAHANPCAPSLTCTNPMLPTPCVPAVHGHVPQGAPLPEHMKAYRVQSQWPPSTNTPRARCACQQAQSVRRAAPSLPWTGYVCACNRYQACVWCCRRPLLLLPLQLVLRPPLQQLLLLDGLGRGRPSPVVWVCTHLMST